MDVATPSHPFLTKHRRSDAPVAAMAGSGTVPSPLLESFIVSSIPFVPIFCYFQELR